MVAATYGMTSRRGSIGNNDDGADDDYDYPTAAQLAASWS